MYARGVVERTSEGGAPHGAVQEVMDSTGMIDNTRRLVEAARAAGATIVHAPITFAEGFGELADHPYGILKGASAGSTPSRPRTSTSSCARAGSRRSRSAAS